MPPFVLRNDNPEIPPPYEFPGITIQSFRLPADQNKLQKICDDLLNIGCLQHRGFEFRAIAGFVDMDIVTYPTMKFAGTPYSGWGFASQQELYFRFIVWKLIYVSGLLIPDAVPEFCIPFIYVDNSWSMISGRNVLGFPKAMARFSPTPVLGANPFQITVCTDVLETHHPDTKLEMKPIVTINPSQHAPQVPDGLWPWLGLAIELSDPVLNECWQLLLAAFPDAFATVGLKQFRDASSPTEACYQAIVATRFEPQDIGPPSPLPPATVTLSSYASLDIPRSLGIPANQPIEPSLQYQVRLNLSSSAADDLFVNTCS